MVILIVSIVFGILVCNRIYSVYGNGKDNIDTSFSFKKIFYVDKLSCVFYVAIPVINVLIYFLNSTEMTTIQMLYSYIIATFTTGLSVIDLKFKLLPTKVITFALLIWLVITSISLINDVDYMLYAILPKAVLGCLFAFIIFMGTYIASGKKLGGGDVRLATVMGLFLTSDNILSALLLGVLISAIYSLVMMILKKLNPKDSIPLCPFLCIGTILSLCI